MKHCKKFISICSAAIVFFCGGLTHLANASAPTFVVCCINLTVTGPYSIDLSWTGAPSSAGVTGYQIEREFPVGGGFTTIVANTGSTATTYSDTNLSAGITYSYRISGVNSDGVGPPSPVLAAIGTPNVQSPIPPGRTQIPTATVISGSEIDLAWTAPDQGGAPITGYKIERENPSGGFTTIVANSSSTATTYADTNLSSGATYSYRVSAINKYGTSYYASPPVSAATATQPSAPQRVTAVPGDGQATIDWLPPLFPGGDITGYVVTGGATTSSVSVSNNTRNATITGLTNGISYSFSVSAVNKAGQGPPGITSQIVPGANLPLQAAPSFPLAAVAEPPVLQSLQDQLNSLTAMLQALILQAEEKDVALPQSVKQPVAPSSKFLSDLSFGLAGDDVRALQLFLISQNTGVMAQKLAAYGANGHFGFLTKNALAEYQKNVGISPAVGFFGPKTRAYVNSLGRQ